jgi:hypothetical protein
LARWQEPKPRTSESDDDRRRRFACPPQRGRFDGIELALLDPADADDRHMLILAEHEDLAAAIGRGEDEILVGEAPMNPHLHITTHEIVVTQLWENDPPEAWATAKRLLAAGYGRHDVLHMIGSALMGEIWETLPGAEVDAARDGYVRRLEELPESWHRLDAAG